MDLVSHAKDTVLDAQKRIENRILPGRRRRKVRRGEKMQKFMDKLDPAKRVAKLTGDTDHA